MRELPTSPYFAVAAEGGRLGLVTCLLCGATLIIGGDSEATALHEKWHAARGDLAEETPDA